MRRRATGKRRRRFLVEIPRICGLGVDVSRTVSRFARASPSGTAQPMQIVRVPALGLVGSEASRWHLSWFGRRTLNGRRPAPGHCEREFCRQPLAIGQLKGVELPAVSSSLRLPKHTAILGSAVFHVDDAVHSGHPTVPRAYLKTACPAYGLR